VADHRAGRDELVAQQCRLRRHDAHAAPRRRLEERLDGGVGEEPAAADHDEVLGGQRHLAHEVRADQHRAALGREVLEQVADPQDALGVQAVHRLVEDQRAGVAEQRGGDAESLAHAEREPARSLAGHLRQPDDPQHVVDARGGDAVGLREGEQRAAGRAAGVGHPGVEVRAHLLQRRGRIAVGAAADRGASGVRPVEPHDHAHGGRLARAVRPEEARDGAGPHREAEVVDGALVAIDLGQAVCLDHVRIPFWRSRSRREGR